MNLAPLKYCCITLLLASLVACSHAETASMAPPPSTPAPTPASAKQEKKETPESVVVCRAGAEEKRLEIFPRDGGCALRYTKQGKSADVATSKKGLHHCKKALKKIQGRLKTGGYRCELQ